MLNHPDQSLPSIRICIAMIYDPYRPVSTTISPSPPRKHREKTTPPRYSLLACTAPLPHSTAAPARAEFFSSRRRRTPPLPRRSRGLPQPPPEPETTLDGTEVVPSRHRTPPQPAPTGTMVVPSSAGPVPGIAPDGAEVIPSRCRTLPQPAPTSHEVCPYRCQSPSAANHIRIPPQHAPAGAEVVPPSAGATPGTSPSEAEVVPPSTGGWSCVWACPSGAEVVPRPPLPPTFFCYLFPKVRYAGTVDAR
ncbi:SH3 domain-containing protein C23A1.17 [Oryza sativa Japonica Group]|uniref:Expressed protein n=4 Tax=Oryza TaxID=4527 RepID=Q10GF7_ORYSJ|nr:SH3 domain-containing protein C23A1.17 [Oryza sativa Japonica Group]XP_015633164.1 SH3 domain-containing protein C23A1.17 [Oryza sativa Japonica Group]XP_015633165.1 SH3 domain-containing protein C23A1.17 [Oryza sativa Japonica Group]XP_015633166.1 SH3 domain-containing protein C23A1.17 [Oryza sativa Japonica Group]XP_015633167.1 SH3 domain-containing protein C23A1.17 [Oryza sativa Japonica Group]KAB8092698.1 hypothetical protein EE612_019056 [Oryza sativa]ABF97745.1 expressed protein [Ory